MMLRIYFFLVSQIHLRAPTHPYTVLRARRLDVGSGRPPVKVTARARPRIELRRAWRGAPLSAKNSSLQGKEAAPVGGAASSSLNTMRPPACRRRSRPRPVQPMQIIGGLLRVAGGGENRPLVVLQDLQPRRDIGGVVVAGFRRDAKIGAEKRRADFGNKLLHRIARIGETLAA